MSLIAFSVSVACVFAFSCACWSLGFTAGLRKGLKDAYNDIYTTNLKNSAEPRELIETISPASSNSSKPNATESNMFPTYLYLQSAKQPAPIAPASVPAMPADASCGICNTNGDVGGMSASMASSLPTSAVEAISTLRLSS
eukprot:5023660-Pleurochrysis_carterae.AAC.1